MARSTTSPVEGDTQASQRLARVYSQHRALLVRQARRLAGPSLDAEDLVQETFTRVVAEFGSKPLEGSALRAWLSRALMNTFLAQIRKARVRQHATDDSESADEGHSVVIPDDAQP